jgi:hypothetical protein
VFLEKSWLEQNVGWTPFMARLVVFSSPSYLPQEGATLNRLFASGLHCCHLRKPDSSVEALRRLLNDVQPQYHPHIRLHQHHQLAEEYGARQGLDRRRFLQTSCGMATAFLAMNQVFGRVFEVSEAEAVELEVAQARAEGLAGQFIFDVQSHFIRDDFTQEGLLGLGEFASKHWNPEMLKDMGLTLERYRFDNFLKEIYLDSETDLALLSGAPFDDPEWWPLTNAPIATALSLTHFSDPTRPS